MLEALGSHWIHPDRNLYGSKSCSLELLYLKDPLPGFGWDETKERVRMAREKEVDVWLRVDYRHRNVLPQMWDDGGVIEYCEGIQQAVAEMNVRGIICGNEVNMLAEVQDGEIQPWWVARVVYGHTIPGDRTDCVYQFAKTVREDIQVLAPAIAPWCGAPDGSAGDVSGLVAPDGRHQVQSWESYQYDMARSCYDSLGHVPNISDIQFCAHTYGRVGDDGNANNGEREPWTDVRDWQNSHGAQFGTRWFQDAIYYMREGQRNSPYGSDHYPPILVGEANTLTDGSPIFNYPKGWEKELVYYIRQFPNIMGLCMFVDQDYGGMWSRTCMTYGEGKLPLWDNDHDKLLRMGW